MGVSTNGDTPKWMVYQGKSQSRMDDNQGYSHWWKPLDVKDDWLVLPMGNPLLLGSMGNRLFFCWFLKHIHEHNMSMLQGISEYKPESTFHSCSSSSLILVYRLSDLILYDISLFFYLSVCLSVCVSTSRFIYLPVYLPPCLSICLSIHPSIHPLINQSIPFTLEL